MEPVMSLLPVLLISSILIFFLLLVYKLCFKVKLPENIIYGKSLVQKDLNLLHFAHSFADFLSVFSWLTFSKNEHTGHSRTFTEQRYKMRKLIANSDLQYPSKNFIRPDISVETKTFNGYKNAEIEVFFFIPKTSKVFLNPSSNLSDENTMFFYHGGGWMIGDINHFYFYLLQNLAIKLNMVIIAPEYRTAPEFIYPTAFLDCFNTTNQLSVNTL